MSTGGGRGGEPDSPSWCAPHVDLTGHLSRRKFSRRCSSGYISDGDSQPSSPQSTRPVMDDRATQTVSPTGQVMMHALHRMAEDHGAGPRVHLYDDSVPNSSETGRPSSTWDTQTQTFGRELRLIGDDYNRLLMSRRERREHRLARNPPVLPPHIHRKPVAMLCVSLLLFLIGRFMYMQSSTNSQDHSQV